MRVQKASDVDRFQNTGFLFDPISAIKKNLENLYVRISRVDWKVPILTYRFSQNFFISRDCIRLRSSQNRFQNNYRMVLRGEAKNQAKSLKVDFIDQNKFEKIFGVLKILAMA